MRRIIDDVLRIVEGVNVKINFDPVVDLTRAHAHTHARLISITSKSMSKMVAKDTCQRAGSAANSRASDTHLLGWWNGRHVRLRGVCRKACGFKSRPEHQHRW